MVCTDMESTNVWITNRENGAMLVQASIAWVIRLSATAMLSIVMRNSKLGFLTPLNRCFR